MTFNNSLENHINVFKNLETHTSDLNVLIEKCTNTLKKGGKVLFCGNGGSSSDAQHLAAEFVGRFKNNRASLPSLSLSADSSVITCIANDFGYENIFSRQIESLANKDDVIILITTSGNSENIINAAIKAKELGIFTAGFLGKDGGKVLKLIDLPLLVESSETARIQEAHIFIGHCLVESVEKSLGY
tara:strand:+ start:4330 stop:4890 length:561 start_codon:yes stop_codon:yes gene_type:complete